MAGGMAGSAVTVFLFGYATELIHLYSVPVYVSLWLAKRPAAVSGLALLRGHHWQMVPGENTRLRIRDLEQLRLALAALVVDYGYDLCFLLPASLLLGGACLILTSLIPDPIELQKPAVRRVSISEEENNEDDESAARSPLLGNVEVTIASPRQRPPPLGVVGALKIEGVVLFALSYACLKLVNYAFFFWLPAVRRWRHNSWHNLRPAQRPDVVPLASALPVLILGDAAALLAYSWSPEDRIVNAFLMAMAGFFVGGPANIISSATCADLGRRPELRGNAEALGTVTGIIDGTGSMGAALGQAAIPGIQAAYGWGWVFYLFVSMIGLSLLCVLPVLVRDIKRRFFSNNRAAEVQVAE
uniref:Sugar phosphate exchanger 3 n=1 Tax=Macrostomum lignano TaxID=282301 RepID=A0A1I8FJY6_9PLAT